MTALFFCSSWFHPDFSGSSTVLLLYWLWQCWCVLLWFQPDSTKPFQDLKIRLFTWRFLRFRLMLLEIDIKHAAQYLFFYFPPRLHVVTWNVATAEPPDDVSSLLQLNSPKSADLYIIGYRALINYWGFQDFICATIGHKCDWCKILCISLQEVNTGPLRVMLHSVFDDPWSHRFMTSLGPWQYIKVWVLLIIHSSIKCHYFLSLTGYKFILSTSGGIHQNARSAAACLLQAEARPFHQRHSSYVHTHGDFPLLGERRIF